MGADNTAEVKLFSRFALPSRIWTPGLWLQTHAMTGAILQVATGFPTEGNLREALCTEALKQEDKLWVVVHLHTLKLLFHGRFLFWLIGFIAITIATTFDVDGYGPGLLQESNP